MSRSCQILGFMSCREDYVRQMNWSAGLVLRQIQSLPFFSLLSIKVTVPNKGVYSLAEISVEERQDGGSRRIDSRPLLSSCRQQEETATLSFQTNVSSAILVTCRKTVFGIFYFLLRVASSWTTIEPILYSSL